ncbi:hypothetical protein EJC49_10725 [Aquibium carbonis]|uniref:Uncharacterized protein n=1 Tax=Aquibium carbonis TaxID=2495581 RepID=A0A3R9Y8E3_9HYPH|nr:hypothetical protein [Aquibium carbonis]RST86450.1 hypothetical protein EJC49_10725 [Aquibium carbonis]
MSARDPDGLSTTPRLLDAHALERVSPLPPPDEVFADWLLSVPHGADLAADARRQVELIDARGVTHPDVACLRMLLVAVAEDAR